MQTFLPYPDFKKSAKILDFRRLGKQRLECVTILRGKWPNHSVSKMWLDYHYQLCEYAKEICLEWRRRGYKDVQYDVVCEMQKHLIDTGLPPWFGNKTFHRAHKSNLVRKKPDYYRKYFPDVPDNLPYLYPK
jgi:hypothetical protein